MQVRKDLKRNEPNIQAYVKFSAQRMIKRGKDREYSFYAKYKFSLLYKPKAVYIWSFSEVAIKCHTAKFRPLLSYFISLHEIIFFKLLVIIYGILRYIMLCYDII